jgi:DNA invertase Pin-like site-specific DNA recombinase
VSGHWLVYVRRSYKKMGSENVASSADTSDEVQLERCVALLPSGATHEVFTDSGGHQSGRSDKRDGWRAVIARIEEGGVAGIVAYDISRLARNARLVLNLHHALEQSGADLRIAQMPGTDLTSAQGRFLLTILAGAAAFQADYDSQRMKDMMRATFEAGGHRGNDPFGYRTMRDKQERVIHPRTLEVVPEEAEVVRRAFGLLREHSHAGVAGILNVEGVPHGKPGPWTHNTVKDLWRRRDLYRGLVTTRRGLESRPGRHPAILSEDEHRDAEIAVRNRQSRKGRRVRNVKRTYLLSGLAVCGECGHRLRGDTRVSRGNEWRYYNCPVAEHRSFVMDAEGNLIACSQRRVQASGIESAVLDALASRRLPAEAWDEAERELRRRLSKPTEGTADKSRAHLTKRLEALRKQHEWGDLSDEEYRKAAVAIRSELGSLPSEKGKVIEFSKYRRVASSLPDAIAALGASGRPELVQETLATLLQAVAVRDKGVVRIEPVPAALPFFRAETGDVAASFWRPRTDSNRRRQP